MAILGKFFAAFGQEKVESGVKGLTTWLASIDPKTATAAQLKILKEKRDDYAQRLRKAGRALDKDRQETKDAQNEVEKAKQALNVLKGRMTGDDAKDQVTLVQANKIADKMRNFLIPTLEREMKEDLQAQAVVDALQKLYDQMCQMVEKSGSRMQEAERRMLSAQADAEHAELMKELNGASEKFSGVDIAFDALTAAAEEAEDKAAVAKMTTGSGDSTDSLVDDIIADAATETSEKNDPFSLLK